MKQFNSSLYIWSANREGVSWEGLREGEINSPKRGVAFMHVAKAKINMHYIRAGDHLSLSFERHLSIIHELYF